MAFVIRRTGASGAVSPFWFAKYRGPDGQLIVRTTKQRDKKKAQAFARELELAAEKARHGELTQAAILKGLGDLLERTTGERLNIVSTKDFCAEWLRLKAIDRTVPIAAALGLPGDERKVWFRWQDGRRTLFHA